MKPKRCPVKNERGSTIVAALLILVLLTIIGIAAINSSTTERATSANYLLYERVFFTAEAGLEHAPAALRRAMDPYVSVWAMNSVSPNFSFALSQLPDKATASFPTGYDLSLLSTTRPTGYKLLKYNGSEIVNSPLEGYQGYQYTINIWDNMDDADPTVDSDGTIFMLAQAEGPKNSKCSIFTILEVAGSDSLSGYNAQEGAGSGKGHSSLDKTRITDFTTRVGRDGGPVVY